MTEEESADRKRKLADTIKNDGCSLPWKERSQLHSLLLKHHDMFQLDDAEQGETDLVQTILVMQSRRVSLHINLSLH